MSDYTDYKAAKDAIDSLIQGREADLQDVEADIAELKRVRRMLDEEFRTNMHKKANYLG